MQTREQVEQALRKRKLHYDCLDSENVGWLIVVPELGAKIVAAGVDRENLFWTNGELDRSAWCAGGQRTWLAPELGRTGFFAATAEDWRVPPELDPGRYRRVESPNGQLSYRCDLAIKRLDGRLFHLGIVRSIGAETIREHDCAPGLRIRIENRLINRMESVLEEEVGLWSILQAPALSAGTVLIPVRPLAKIQDRQPPGHRQHPDPENRYRLYFGAVPQQWVRETSSMIYLKSLAGIWFKIGIPPEATDGRIALIRPSHAGKQRTLTILRCPVDRSATYLDRPPMKAYANGDVLQFYNSPDADKLNFCELESHAPAARLAPGAEQEAHVEILLFKDDSTRIFTIARNLVGSRFDPSCLFQ